MRAPSVNGLFYSLRVTLLDTGVWREVLVPSSLSATQLHEVIQLAMGWEQVHLHEFRRNDNGTVIPDSAKIDALFSAVGSSLLYLYDFGDGWEHEVKLTKKLQNTATKYPQCKSGRLACPPEDSGGPPGYHELVHLKAKKRPTRQEKELLNWAGKWDPKIFDLKAVNDALSEKFKPAKPKAQSVKKPAPIPPLAKAPVPIGQRIGYVRVSTLEQNTDRQLDGIQLDQVFTDKASGKDTARPELENLRKFVRIGDTVIVHSMDRLARNLDDLRGIVADLTKRGVQIQFLKESLTFTGEDSPMANLMLSVMGAFAEFERALIKERQREGVALAKQRGAYKGRKKALGPDQVAKLKERVAGGESKTQVARDLGVSRETLYQYLRST